MAHINPETLKKLRNTRSWTLDRLAEKSRVDKQTIHRLEHGQIDQPRETTLKKLAKALGVEPERLTGPVSDEPESAPAWEPNKSQLNLRISDQARNALLLVCERYHVRPAQVVELAPLLFNWAAEKSLRQRRERIDTLQQRESEISEELERFNSDLGELSDGMLPPIELPYTSDFWFHEESALSSGYLFSFDPFESPSSDLGFGYAGPIIDLLNDLASEIGDEAEFAGWWDGDSSPAYSICKEEAKWLANGDEAALENILQGHAPLNEFPKEFWEQLRNRNHLVPSKESDEVDAIRRRQAAERVKWLRAHGRPDDSPEVGS